MNHSTVKKQNLEKITKEKNQINPINNNNINLDLIKFFNPTGLLVANWTNTATRILDKQIQTNLR